MPLNVYATFEKKAFNPLGDTSPERRMYVRTDGHTYESYVVQVFDCGVQIQYITHLRAAP